tara:strand:- start:739 stop:2619 length:1881 start_codon:yes stop_codon:yes gene_type:complete
LAQQIQLHDRHGHLSDLARALVRVPNIFGQFNGSIHRSSQRKNTKNLFEEKARSTSIRIVTDNYSAEMSLAFEFLHLSTQAHARRVLGIVCKAGFPSDLPATSNSKRAVLVTCPLFFYLELFCSQCARWRTLSWLKETHIMTYIDPDMASAANIVPRLTIEAICNKRDHVLEEYAAAYDKIEEAQDAIKQAYQVRGDCAPIVNSYNQHIDDQARSLLVSISAPSREEYLSAARHMVDTDVWAYLVEHTRVLKLMDRIARREFREQLLRDPPEVTYDNVQATLEEIYLQYTTIFQRSIATSFSSLDRRFKSHDGWKIGSRVILDRALDDFRHWSSHRYMDDLLRDIERVFFILDGKEIPEEYASVVVGVPDVAGSWGRARQGYFENEYFRVRVFLNGNVHIYFRRDDLLNEVNRHLGEYYGAPIPQDTKHRDTSQDDLFDAKLTPAKNFGLFPTPDLIRNRLFERLMMYRRPDDTQLRFLEPQAGTGALASYAAEEEGALVDCVEIQPQLAMELKASKLYNKVTTANFLDLSPDPDNLYDRIGMNPPFDRERDIDHVVHALKFLKPGGILCTVMSAATEFRETKKSIAFQKLVKQLGGRFEDLPERSFSDVGTNVNTVLLTIRTKET